MGEMLGIRAAKDPTGFIGIADAIIFSIGPGVSARILVVRTFVIVWVLDGFRVAGGCE